MNFDDLRDQLREQVQNYWARLQDSTAYIQARERYEGLSSTGQKLAWVGAALLLVLIVFYIPWSYFDSSSSAMADFESKRELTRELLKVSRNLDLAPPPHITAADLRGRVESELHMMALQADQIAKVSELAPDAMRAVKLSPPSLNEEGVEVILNKLNLKQVIEIGFKLQNLSEAVKLSGLKITANAKDAHYFDASFQLASFSVPLTPIKGAK